MGVEAAAALEPATQTQEEPIEAMAEADAELSFEREGGTAALVQPTTAHKFEVAPSDRSKLTIYMYNPMSANRDRTRGLGVPALC